MKILLLILLSALLSATASADEKIHDTPEAVKLFIVKDPCGWKKVLTEPWIQGEMMAGNHVIRLLERTHHPEDWSDSDPMTYSLNLKKRSVIVVMGNAQNDEVASYPVACPD